MYVCMYTCTLHTCIGACVYMHVCACVCTCVCMHVYVCICMCACMYVHVRVCMHVCVHACLACQPLMCCLLSPQSAVECSSLLRTLHGLEQEHLRRSLALQQEEDFARAHRQLAIFQRNEVHRIFFAQIKSAIFKGDLKPEAAKMLLQDYAKIQVVPRIRLPGRHESFS